MTTKPSFPTAMAVPAPVRTPALRSLTVTVAVAASVASVPDRSVQLPLVKCRKVPPFPTAKQSAAVPSRSSSVAMTGVVSVLQLLPL